MTEPRGVLQLKLRGWLLPLLPVLQLTYLPPPWGECRSSEMGLDFFPVYSITACRIDCETRYIVENCNCRMVHMPGQCQGRAATGHPGPPATFFAFLTRWDTLHPLHKDAKGCCSGKTVIWCADISGADGNLQSGNQGNIPGLQSGQKLGEHSSQCSIRLLAACSSSLLELSDHLSGCLQFSHPGVVHIQTSRCLLLSSSYFPSCIQISSTLSSGARVHQPANERVCPDISVVRLTTRLAITRGSRLVTASRGWCWPGPEELGTAARKEGRLRLQSVALASNSAPTTWLLCDLAQVSKRLCSYLHHL